MDGSSFPLRVLAEGIARPANVGALFRLADAFGVESLHLCGGSFLPPHQKIRRVARSAETWVRYVAESDGPGAARRMKEDGFRVVGLEITPQSQNIRALGALPGRPTCLVIGSERAGLSPGLLSACETVFNLPMLGRGTSMNVAVATGIALYEITRSFAAAE